MLSETTTLPKAPGSALDAVVGILSKYQGGEYYAYEDSDTWYIGLGSHASLVVSPDGKTAIKFSHNEKKESFPVAGSLNDTARAFVTEYSSLGRIFGQVGFNYSAIVSGQSYNCGHWPVLSLVVPRIHITVSQDSIIVAGNSDEEVRSANDFIKCDLIGGAIPTLSNAFMEVDVEMGRDDYISRVGLAISQIKEGRYCKAIPSRMVNLPKRVDMLATLYHGRRANTPARTFTLSHAGRQATGFSPEVLLSIRKDTVFTEALAGTQLSDRADSGLTNNALLNDPKEVMEHCIAIKGSIRRLSPICSPDSISVKNFMSIMPRGNVQHLFSRVMGTLRPGTDGWDALPGLVANITVPGIPGEGNLEAINAFEPHPRDMYCGAVLMLDPGASLFEATLVLRTVFQDEQRQWLQAGAGVTGLSKPEREFIETCEKLGSIFPYVVAEAQA